MKKMLIAVFVLLLLVGASAGAMAEGELRIVATTFPAYDWTRHILGDRLSEVRLVMLLDSGVDLHNYQPTVADMAELATSDLFICVGGESDAWVEGALRAVDREDVPTVNMIAVLGDAAVPETIVEGMQHDDEDDHDEDDHDEDDHEHEEHETDEHVWLSLVHAQTLCRAIAQALSELDPEHAALYADNATVYCGELAALDAKYAAALQPLERDTLLFADRFPFRYLCDDYGLSYYAAFPGCSAETEASFETMAFLTQKVSELDLHTVMVTESSDGAIAKTVIENSGADRTIAALDAMQSTTATDVNGGADYISIMEKNLDVISGALS